jgi:alkylation response protein AidB-like acyl-CoA dehydrogenase
MTDSLDLAEAIAMIRQSAEGIANKTDLGRVRSLRHVLPGFDRTVWNHMCEMGWPALRMPEHAGGVGLPMPAYCSLAHELGQALLPEPLIGGVLAAAHLSDRALAQQVSGEALFLPAWQCARDCATPDGQLEFAAGRLSGHWRYVGMAAGADGFVVLGQARAYLVAANAAGLSMLPHATQDGGHYADLTLHQTPALDLGPLVPGALAEATLATAAYLLGIIDGAIERTAEHLRTRIQFGKPIGSFQALQHRMVDLQMEAELTRASIDDAALRYSTAPDTPAAEAAVSRAKARASTAALLVTRQAIQLHGGIGFTDEHDISLFLRKAMVVAPQFGSTALHRARFAQIQPFERN